jgi:lysophospholipase L1-like esterase
MRAMRVGIASLLSVVAFACALSAQSPSDSAARIAELEERVTRYLRLLADWGGLTRYGSEDAEIPAPKPGERRVVFFGDEVTELWGTNRPPFGPGKPYFNRGIARQTTPQMLVRFRQDVIALKPRVVVIAGGLNDVARISGPGTRGTFADNVMSMTELAQAHGIRVVLASITPICDCGSNQTSVRSPARIADFNEWMKTYAAQAGAVYLDYYSALAHGRTLRPDLTRDGLVPNDAGFAVMAPLAERAIDAALNAK